MMLIPGAPLAVVFASSHFGGALWKCFLMGKSQTLYFQSGSFFLFPFLVLYNS